jgi:hypothetical protein
LIEFGDSLADCDRLNSEMHLEAGIEQVWRCNWRLRLSVLRDALGGRDRASLEEYLEAVDLEGGATAAETLFIG